MFWASPLASVEKNQPISITQTGPNGFVLLTFLFKRKNLYTRFCYSDWQTEPTNYRKFFNSHLSFGGRF